MIRSPPSGKSNEWLRNFTHRFMFRRQFPIDIRTKKKMYLLDLLQLLIVTGYLYIRWFVTYILFSFQLYVGFFYDWIFLHSFNISITLMFLCFVFFVKCQIKTLKENFWKKYVLLILFCCKSFLEYNDFTCQNKHFTDV